MSGVHGPEFHGSTTVGERGQIVLPAKLRKELGIAPGDKLIVMSGGMPGAPARIMLMKADDLNRMLVVMEEHQQAIRDIIVSNGNGAPAKRSVKTRKNRK
jgi:AbrB family looped-hinge helix DNA binding protein